MTPEGHTFSGWITFSAPESDGQTTAQAQVLDARQRPDLRARARDGRSRPGEPLLGATLTRLAAHFGHDGRVDTNVTCVDRKRQWARWNNVWHSAAIRSTIYTAGTPGRAFRRRLKRVRTVG